MARKAKIPVKKHNPFSQGESVQLRLKEAEDTLQAIREGAVDALVVETGDGEQIYTLKSADYPYRMIIDNMIQGAVIFDDDETIFYANSTFARMVNYPHSDLLGLSVTSFISDEDRELFRRFASPSSDVTGGSGNMHVVCRNREDLSVYVGLIALQIDDQNLHCAIFTDLTEQNKYDQALADEKFSRSILEQTGEAVVVCDFSGRIIRRSRAADRLVGKITLHARFQEKFRLFSSAEPALSSTDDQESEAGGLLDQVVGGKTLYGHEMYLRVGPKNIPLILNAQPLKGGEDRIVGAIITMIDITERKKAEQELQDFNDSLEQRIVNRTRDLVSYQNHLRTMSSELVMTEHRERRRLANELHDYLAQLLVVGRMKVGQLTRNAGPSPMKTEIEEIDKILSDSLEYTRTLIAELSPNILYELGIVPALIWLGRQFKRHEMSVSVHGEEENISLPEDQSVFVYQAVRELLFNVKKHADTNQATVSLKKTAPHQLQVKVEDRGKGLRALEQPQDFSTSGKFGLFSIRERLEAMGGSLHIDSGLAGGTCITLLVPYQVSTPSEVVSSTQSLQRTPGTSSDKFTKRKSGIRILLVDDHTMVREGIRGILESQSDFHVVGEARDGIEAIEHSRSLHPDVVVMDVNMPRLNGIEATRRILVDCPSIRIIGLSVQEDEQVEKLLLEAGAARYLTKSGISTELVHSIRGLIAEHS